MKNFRNYFAIVLGAAALVFVSCASVQNSGKAKPAAVLPLNAGWYQYDSDRTWKGIEDEYNFELSTGMKMVMETTWKYTGVVCRFEDGVLYDPVSEVELLIDREGGISCAQNISIKGNMEKNGRFFWGGLKEEHGRLNSISVKGTLIPLPPSARGGREFEGIYRLRHAATNKEILANIADGFYTWKYLDGEDAGFSPWPTLIAPDGSFGFSIEITTVAKMGEIASTNMSTLFSAEGKVIPGQSISLEEVSRSSGQGFDQGGAPQAYAGTAIHSGEYPNEAIPADIESLVRSGRSAIKAEPKPNRTQYPAWYLKLPVKSGFMYAAGEKTFDVKETAFAMAEAAAAANLAEQIRVHIENTTVEVSNDRQTIIDERIKSESLQRMNFKIIERVYNEETHTAFALAELAVN
ncbi:MAG: hypothetical protein LBH20_01945 [Treponema sp.]|jgi:hypothetical protein|nr:hypothetical protein [Treponema sp.]